MINDEMLFNAAYEAIQNEENELNNLFDLNKHYYQKNHHGVCMLYETTFVYLIIKELLKIQYPLTAYWEYPYPSNSKQHCDLALINKEGVLDSLIEFKIWTTDDDIAIKNDVFKLQKEQGCNKYIFVIGYGGDINENNNYLCRDNAPLKIVKMRGFKTKFYKAYLNKVEDNELNLFMYKVL
jgi:hypothetical protein